MRAGATLEHIASPSSFSKLKSLNFKEAYTKIKTTLHIGLDTSA
jgi:hypothetical protein